MIFKYLPSRNVCSHVRNFRNKTLAPEHKAIVLQKRRKTASVFPEDSFSYNSPILALLFLSYSMLLFWNIMQFYLDTLPGNQEIAQYVGWHCQTQDLRKIRRLCRLAASPTPKAGRAQNGLRLIENRGEGKEPPEEARSSGQRLQVQLPSPAAAAELRKLLVAAVPFGGGRMLRPISRTTARSGRGLGGSSVRAC